VLIEMEPDKDSKNVYTLNREILKSRFKKKSLRGGYDTPSSPLEHVPASNNEKLYTIRFMYIKY